MDSEMTGPRPRPGRKERPTRAKVPHPQKDPEQNGFLTLLCPNLGSTVKKDEQGASEDLKHLQSPELTWGATRTGAEELFIIIQEESIGCNNLM